VSHAPQQVTRVSAYSLCRDDDALLLSRIAPGATVSSDGMWTLPGGGLEFGEDPDTGVLRELSEETGLVGTVGELLGVRSAILEPEMTKRGDRLHVVGVVYRVDAAEADLVMELDGSTDLAAWVPFTELEALPALPLVRWATERAGR
jgi:8-oxo-dGTP diphosphatase